MPTGVQPEEHECSINSSFNFSIRLKLFRKLGRKTLTKTHLTVEETEAQKGYIPARISAQVWRTPEFLLFEGSLLPTSQDGQGRQARTNPSLPVVSVKAGVVLAGAAPRR